jgi:preprotein translocase subunit SecA
MLSVINKLFDSNNKEIAKLAPLIKRINEHEESVKKLKDADFPKKTEELKKRLQEGETQEALLPESFALVREAARRTIGLRHFDVQLMAAIVLSRGKIAEQKTGEGKTLSAVPALFLNSLTGRGVHLVTVNDYLARRDAGWMGPVFHLLGVSLASIINDESFLYDPSYVDTQASDYRLVHLRPVTRKEAYQADVVYGINSEFGFDYLRDNMAQSLSELVQRDYHYAIVDEVDSVLIDEARTPHIISAPDDEPSAKYYEYAEIIKKLSPDIDFKIDEKLRTAHLTDHGIGKVEKLFGVPDIYEKDFDTVYHLEASLKARALFHKEKDYIVKDNEVILVDEFTGRLMEGRRLSEGLHQAIEAKEGVPIQRESKTLATVSLQNYFRMYEKLAGMTGTAVTEAEEFRKIYQLDVVVLPTNNPLLRSDYPDSVYKTTRAKLSAVANTIEEAHKRGQPVLVGTTSIDKNMIISDLLKRRKITHEVLNAKNHEREAEIIAEAGKKGAVTVATNMAGRGVDIILGGESPKTEDGRADHGTPEWKAWEKAHNDVLDTGGLMVIGTERHESRRIDNQLRGRSGRQGDPGVSRYFVALDDDIMRIFGGDRIAGIMSRFNMPEDVPLEHGLVSRAIENAQVKVEGFNFDSRKHLVEYDDVLNKQREIVYRLRRKVLESEKIQAAVQAESATDEKEAKGKTAKAKKAGKGTKGTPDTLESLIDSETLETLSLKDDVLERVDTTLENLVDMAQQAQEVDGTGSLNERIMADYVTIVPFDETSQQQLVKQLEQSANPEEKKAFLIKLTRDLYNKREDQVGSPIMRQVEKQVMLSVIDNLWMNHLDAIDHLRSGIGLRGYAQRDPLVEYKNEAYQMFQQLIFGIDDEIVHRIFRIQIQHAHTHDHDHDHTHEHEHEHKHSHKHKKIMTNTPESEVSAEKPRAKGIGRRENAQQSGQLLQQTGISSSAESPIIDKKKLGRNDPCWCGSGKKYKRCHFPN